MESGAPPWDALNPTRDDGGVTRQNKSRRRSIEPSSRSLVGRGCTDDSGDRPDVWAALERGGGVAALLGIPLALASFAGLRRLWAERVELGR